MNKSDVPTSLVVDSLLKEIFESKVVGSLSPQETLEKLNSYGIDWYLTQRGDLAIRYWQVVAERFILPEQVGPIQGNRAVPPEAKALEWVSKNLVELRETYADSWIAVVGDQVVAASTTLLDLLQKISNLKIDQPFITEIPAKPVVWETTYVRCEV